MSESSPEPGIAEWIERLPLEETGRNLNAVLTSVNGVVGGVSPLLRRLPAIAGNFDQAVLRADAALGSIERGYGDDSAFAKQIGRMTQQVSEAARSVRDLADQIERHPEALISGRGK